MPYSYQVKALYCDQVSLAEIAASAGTPCYVYSAAGILERYHAYDQSFGDHPHQVCYAVKANSNLSLLRLLAEAGAGFDIVSGGELYRVLQAGGDPTKTVFAGVGNWIADEVLYQARISPKRLALMPYVDLCVECQQAKDGPRSPTGRRHLRDFK